MIDGPGTEGPPMGAAGAGGAGDGEPRGRVGVLERGDPGDGDGDRDPAEIQELAADEAVAQRDADAAVAQTEDELAQLAVDREAGRSGADATDESGEGGKDRDLRQQAIDALRAAVDKAEKEIFEGGGSGDDVEKKQRSIDNAKLVLKVVDDQNLRGLSDKDLVDALIAGGASKDRAEEVAPFINKLNAMSRRSASSLQRQVGGDDQGDDGNELSWLQRFGHKLYDWGNLYKNIKLRRSLYALFGPMAVMVLLVLFVQPKLMSAGGKK